MPDPKKRPPEETDRYGVPIKIRILYINCPAGDTYIDEKGDLRRRPEYDEEYYKNPKGRRI